MSYLLRLRMFLCRVCVCMTYHRVQASISLSFCVSGLYNVAHTFHFVPFTQHFHRLITNTVFSNCKLYVLFLRTCVLSVQANACVELTN